MLNRLNGRLKPSRSNDDFKKLVSDQNQSGA